jgi:hypothetical protein
MLLRYSQKHPNRVLQLGLIALALANVASYLMRRKSGLSESVVDPVVGFAYGVAIAATLLGVYVRQRAGRSADRDA